MNMVVHQNVNVKKSAILWQGKKLILCSYRTEQLGEPLRCSYAGLPCQHLYPVQQLNQIAVVAAQNNLDESSTYN